MFSQNGQDFLILWKMATVKKAAGFSVVASLSVYTPTSLGVTAQDEEERQCGMAGGIKA